MLRGVQIVPVRTPTLPPATHTNTWIVGEGALSIFDPASPYEDEQGRFMDELGERLACGETVERIVLTHHHHDHILGAEALRSSLADKGLETPILAHEATVPLVEGQVRVDQVWAHGAPLDCGGRTLTAHHTPGHAPGHLVFQDAEDGWVIAGDMVAGIGTILLHPDEGDLADYLRSLEHMRTLSPTTLLPSHGPTLPEADALLGMYVAHRHMRTEQIRQALLRLGASTVEEVVPLVYAELEARYHRVAALQITTHLHWMRDHGLAHDAGQGRWGTA
jgi:glyoxylase-like metal-dependent hydrolase (beta-lactamase superfamily II)